MGLSLQINEFFILSFVGAKDNLVMAWDIRTRKLEPIQTMNEAKDCITRIIVNEFEIVVSSLDGCLRRYDLRKGELTCDDLGEPVVYMAQTKDTKCTLAARSDNVLRLLDNDNAESLATYRGHKADDYQIECGILSNDSQIVCGSSNGEVFIWDLVDEKVISRLSIGKINSVYLHTRFVEMKQISIIASNFGYFFRFWDRSFTLAASDHR